MDAQAILQDAKGTPFTSAFGERGIIELEAPISSEEIRKLSDELTSPLPLEYESLLAFCGGFESAIGFVDFYPGYTIREDLFPHGLPIARDGVGNVWLLDLVAGEPTDEIPVFFGCHDPPVIVLQARSITAFIAEVIAYGRREPDNRITAIDEYTANIWKNDPGALTYQDCIQRDSTLSQFAHSLGLDYEFGDMRHAEVGQGFADGKYGSDSITKRHDSERIFARQRRKLSFIQKIFGV